MSNRPIKKKKVVEITQEDFEVEWTPPPRTGRDRLIQFGVLFLIICFLLPVITCAVTPSGPAPEVEQQAQQFNEIDAQIKQYAEQLASKPNDPALLFNLGFYTNQKAESIAPVGDGIAERMTLLATAEKYLRDSMAQDPDYSLATIELAKNLMLQQKPEEANELIAGALESVEPKLASEDEKEANDAKSQKVSLLSLSAKGDLMAQNGASALEKMNQALEIKPGEPRLYLERADVHNAMGNKDSARKDLEMVVEIGQKTGNQRMVIFGQQMIEKLENPPPLEVISVKETDVTPTPTPAE